MNSFHEIVTEKAHRKILYLPHAITRRINRMKCVNCHGDLKKGKAPYTISRKGYHVIIDQLPAWICEECGEPLFETEAVNVIQDIIHSTDEKLAELHKRVA